MFSDLALRLEKYYNYCVPQNGLPYPVLLADLAISVLKPGTGTINKLSQIIPFPELCPSTKIDCLRSLVTALKQYEHSFYNEVLNSDRPNFLITSYYTLYLRFLESLYSRLEVLEPSVPDPDIDNVTKTVNFLIGYFGTPILQYLTKKDITPNVSDLAGILLHALISSGKHVPSKDSTGYYLSLKTHKQ
jgi:hypothetical protein